MTWVDYAILLILGLSVLVGVLRGLVRELISILGWIAAFLLATLFSKPVATLIAGRLGDVAATIVAFVGVFLLVWILAGVVGFLLSKLVSAAGLAWPDRLLGAFFGLARGVIVVITATIFTGLTPLPRSPAWQEAILSRGAEEAALSVMPLLPKALADRVSYKLT